MEIIAEIGTAHKGDLNKAESLIRAAAESGADTAKFQIVFAREILHPATGTVPLPGGDTPLYDVFESLEQNAEFYRSLKEICRTEGIAFLATPFGLESAALLKSLKPQAVKVASPELNYTDLLRELDSWDVRTYLSTGVSTEEDVREAVSFFDPARLILLHCITSYPAPPEEYNLSLLPQLEKSFGVSTGVSDHSLDPLLVPCIAAYHGAVCVEKHFTLSRADDGLDDPIALEPEAFKRMSGALKELECLGREEQRRFLSRRFGDAVFDAVSGNGCKELAPSEKENYGRTNRSVHALVELSAGEVLSSSNCAVLRTEKVLRPGMHPRYYEALKGRRLRNAVPAGQGIREEDLSP